MSKMHEIICIQCPLACRVKVSVNDAAEVQKVTDYQCKEGREYALQEFKSPKRILTTTLNTDDSVRKLLPVRSKSGVPKNMFKECMNFLCGIRAKPVLNMGDTVVPNILGTGVDIVCSDDLV